MQQPIQSPVALEHGIGDLVEVAGEGSLEIEHCDRRLGRTRGEDLGVQRLELCRRCGR